ncbi:unnamed protein product [Protopolystoma xenopodis]|uniref:Uncharacterized protein n=1 Tax=Protopolystoma xenopodis TaxID=117903 RepID=A0A3S5ALF1_9PLAT|nr:unnamed protein product [Protopolystoma xenopodis]
MTPFGQTTCTGYRLAARRLGARRDRGGLLSRESISTDRRHKRTTVVGGSKESVDNPRRRTICPSGGPSTRGRSGRMTEVRPVRFSFAGRKQAFRSTVSRRLLERETNRIRPQSRERITLISRHLCNSAIEAGVEQLNPMNMLVELQIEAQDEASVRSRVGLQPPGKPESAFEVTFVGHSSGTHYAVDMQAKLGKSPSLESEQQLKEPSLPAEKQVNAPLIKDEEVVHPPARKVILLDEPMPVKTDRKVRKGSTFIGEDTFSRPKLKSASQALYDMHRKEMIVDNAEICKLFMQENDTCQAYLRPNHDHPLVTRMRESIISFYDLLIGNYRDLLEGECEKAKCFLDEVKILALHVEDLQTEEIYKNKKRLDDLMRMLDGLTGSLFESPSKLPELVLGVFDGITELGALLDKDLYPSYLKGFSKMLVRKLKVG